MPQGRLFPEKEEPKQIEADKRVILHLWHSGTHYTSGFISYKGRRTLQFGVKHDTCTPLLKRMQKAGILICSTHESESVRYGFQVDLGINLNSGTDEPKVLRPIGGDIVFRFTDIVNSYYCVFRVEYKGEFVTSGIHDRWADPPYKVLKRLKAMGVRMIRNSKARELHKENGFIYGDLFKKD